MHRSPSSPKCQHYRHILPRILECLSDYRVQLGDEVVLGLSGGKDSTSLLLLLREMSIAVHPVIVDLGYTSFDANAIAASSARLGFEPIIVTAGLEQTLHQLTPNARDRVITNLRTLDSTDIHSPCGPCSQIKRTLLVDYAARNHLSFVLLGHQREDFLATILKDYFVQRYYRAHGEYCAETFRLFISRDSVDLNELRAMVERGDAATMGVRSRTHRSVSIIRPMAYIPEHALVSLVQAAEITPFGSGCSHDALQNSDAVPTKREFVHAELRRRLERQPTLGERLLAVALESLDATGHPIFNPRANRAISCPGFTESR